MYSLLLVNMLPVVAEITRTRSLSPVSRTQIPCSHVAVGEYLQWSSGSNDVGEDELNFFTS
jgi:hypothetical protein